MGEEAKGAKRRRHRRAIARAFDPGEVIDPLRLEFAVAEHDPDWRQLQRLSGPLPNAAVEALKATGDLR